MNYICTCHKFLAKCHPKKNVTPLQKVLAMALETNLCHSLSTNYAESAFGLSTCLSDWPLYQHSLHLPIT